MKIDRTKLALICATLALATTACAPSPQSSVEAEPAAADRSAPRMDVRETAMRSPPAVLIPVARSQNAALPNVVVHKSPSCSCCGAWVEHMRDAGFPVEVRNADNLEPVKSRLGVPYGKGSCHTAEVDGYFVEGHVPAGDIKRLLAERPDARGLTLPGMPLGSPGMEVPDGTVQPYTVELVTRDGGTRSFARHPGSGE
jgi:hypothetical protein